MKHLTSVHARVVKDLMVEAAGEMAASIKSRTDAWFRPEYGTAALNPIISYLDSMEWVNR